MMPSSVSSDACLFFGKGVRKGSWLTCLFFSFSLALIEWNNVTPEGYEIWPDNYDAHLNGYRGGIFQQAVSALPETDQLSYELLDPDRFNTYGFEYQPTVSLEEVHIR